MRQALLQLSLQDNEQHASEVAKLQAAREAAEAAKAQLQKDQREELERLKTHYTFRVSGLRMGLPLTIVTKLSAT